MQILYSIRITTINDLPWEAVSGVEKIKKILKDIIWLCEERTPLLNEKHITNCVGELCKSIEKTWKIREKWYNKID